MAWRQLKLLRAKFGVRAWAKIEWPLRKSRLTLFGSPGNRRVRMAATPMLYAIP